MENEVKLVFKLRDSYDTEYAVYTNVMNSVQQDELIYVGRIFKHLRTHKFAFEPIDGKVYGSNSLRQISDFLDKVNNLFTK